MDSSRHAELRRHTDNGPADIAAEAYGEVGIKIFDYLFSLRGRLEHLRDGFYIMNYTRRAHVAAKAADIYHFYRITRLRDEPRLHFVRRADEENFGGRILRADISGNRESRVDVAARSACGDKNSFGF